MSQTFSPSHPCRLDAVPLWDFETDVIIVGFGAAGASAAIEAAEAGAKVTLFEVASGSGGTSAMAGGEIYLGGNGGTPVQRANGFEDRTEDFYRYLMMAGGPDANEAKVRQYADDALAHFHWLETQGVPYKRTFLAGKWTEPLTDDCLIWCGSEESYPFNLQAKPCPRGHTPQWPGYGGGKMLMDKLAARVEALGVDVRYDSRVLALIADDDNSRVHGIVLRSDGELRYARACGGVILCAGGFVLNEAMLKRFAPDALRLSQALSAGHDDGSGIRMGMSVGGAAIHMEQLFSTMPFYPPESLVKGIFVNEIGQRFINEDAYHGRICTYMQRQPGNKIFLLADNAIFERPDELSKIEIAAVGETWEEVEQELGLPPETLSHTVAVFNRHAERGEDPLFHKSAKWLKVLNEPPYVALACGIGEAFYPYFTLGGLDTLPTGEVLTIDGDPIPGLFAAGRTTCGLPRWGEGYSSGMSLGDATYFGRRAGRRAATRR